ncbi:hypothetical protein ACWIG5_20650 [Streptomyces lydicus]
MRVFLRRARQVLHVIRGTPRVAGTDVVSALSVNAEIPTLTAAMTRAGSPV